MVRNREWITQGLALGVMGLGTWWACVGGVCVSSSDCAPNQTCSAGKCETSSSSSGSSGHPSLFPDAGSSSGGSGSTGSSGTSGTGGGAVPQTCSGSANVAKFSGDNPDGGSVISARDYIHPGTDVITQGAWQLYEGNTRRVRLHLEPTNSSQGSWWDFDFGADHIDGGVLQVGSYTDAQRMAFADPGHPGLDVGGDGRGCNTICGDFNVHRFSLDADGGISELEVSWMQRCECGNARLYGCVHWQR